MVLGSWGRSADWLAAARENGMVAGTSLEARQVPDKFEENLRFARKIHISVSGAPDNFIQDNFRKDFLEKLVTNG